VFTAGTGCTTGRLTWKPATTDRGSWPVSFTAANARSGSATTTFVVTAPNQPPVPALSATPTTGCAPLVVTADASASTDPDGSLTWYTFDFGDGTASGPQSSPIATHAYAAGSWTLTVSVADNQRASVVKTIPVVVGPAPLPSNLVGNPSFETGTANWSPTAGSTAQRVPGGSDGSWALQITGTANLSKFGIHDSPNWVSAVPVAGARYRCTAWVRSAAGTGTAMLNLREYLGATKRGEITSPGLVLSPGWQLLALEYTAAASGSTLDFQVLDDPVMPGEVFVTDGISIYQVAGGTVGVDPGADAARIPLVATVAPIPLRSESIISFATSRPGPLRVALFDLSGRRVRTVLDQARAAAGLHMATVDGRDDRGRTLPSGLYFFQIRALEGTSSGRIVIAR
jgi:hypothetical protein